MERIGTDPADQRIVEELAQACLERIEAEGEAVVESVCHAHPQHAAAVRSLLRSLSRVGLLAGSSQPAAIPEHFGDYRLLRRIGSGGMGEVWLAEHLKLQRRVALKLIRSGLCSSTRSRERFRREAEALAKLEHACFCPIYEAGERDGVPFLAMRYVEGETLAARLDRVRQARTGARDATTTTAVRQQIDQAIHWVEKLAEALHTAHERGLVHRDVKPANIVIQEDGEPVLLDLGLAHSLGEEQRLTLSGDHVGTPAYMAPEQISGDGPIERRTDVYALAATLYECVTLRAPHAAGSREALYRKILEERATDPRRLNPRVGPELAAVLGKALEKDPAARFTTALELADELRRVRLREPIRTRRPGPWLRTRRWVQRNPLPAALLALLTLALASTLAVLVGRARVQSNLRAIALATTAADVGREDPQLAFQLARQASRLSQDPVVLERLQESMGQLHAVATLGGHGSQLRSVLWSPAGDRLVTVSQGAPARLWGSDGRPIALLATGSLPWPWAVCWSADGTLLYVGCRDGSVRVFDAGGSLLRVLADAPAGSGYVGGLAAERPPGRRIAAGIGGTVLVWNEGGGLIGELRLADGQRAHDSGCWALAFTADGRLVTAGGHGIGPVFPGRRADYDVRIWNQDGSLHATGPGHTDSIWYVSVSGDRCVTSSLDGTVRIWSLDGKCVHVEHFAPEEVHDAAFDPSGERIAAAGSRGSVRILDRTGRRLHEWRVHNTGLPRLAFGADGSWLVTAGFKNQLVQVWTLDGFELARFAGHLNGVTWVSVSPDGERIASASWDGTAKVWSREPLGARVRSGHDGGAISVQLSPDGTRLLSVSASGELFLWDLGGRLLQRTVAPVPVARPRFHPDGRSVLLTSNRGEVFAWGLDEEPPRRLPGSRHASVILTLPQGTLVSASGNEVWRWDPPLPPRVLCGESAGVGHDRPITSLSASTDGLRLLTTSEDGTAGVWDLESRECCRLIGHGFGVATGQLSRTGARALTGGEDGTARLWQTSDGRCLKVLEGHRGGIRWVGFLPDERSALTAARDGTLRLWDLTSGEVALVLRGHLGAAGDACVLPDGRQAVSASSDGTLRWWWLRPEDLVREAEALPIPEPSAADLRRFAPLLGR